MLADELVTDEDEIADVFDVLDDDVESFAPIPPNINTMKIERTIANTEEPISDRLSDNVVFLSIFSPHEAEFDKNL